MMSVLRRISGFTLIELLIVVAIIGILAAIAIPNFLQAQIRAKVAKVKGDQRNLCNAMEIYHVDKGRYPPKGADPTGYPRTPVWWRYAQLTTPEAYVSSIPFDPFTPPEMIRILTNSPMWGGPWYDYFEWEQNRLFDPGFTPPGGPRQGALYFIASYGPDRVKNPDPLQHHIQYDPSNGTVSAGDITRYGPGSVRGVYAE